MIQVCSNFHSARAFIINTRPDEIVALSPVVGWQDFDGQIDGQIPNTVMGVFAPPSPFFEHV